MQNQHKFSINDKMSNLIKEDHSLLLVISRFGLSLGFGDKTVKEVCDLSGIDSYTFLAVVNFLSEENFEVGSVDEKVSIVGIINYLKSAHDYFLDFKLPAIRNKLLQAVDVSDSKIPYSALFIQFFDEYFSEVRKHMEYEDKVVFPYVLLLISGKTEKKYKISVFQERHNEIDSKLEELKNILIKYYPAEVSNHLLTEVLFDILSCEVDIVSHNRVEDYLFVPAVESVERRIIS
jgi:regulator of cell morphogenesis and NO signaling